MADYVAVLPSIYQPWTDRCMRSCRLQVEVIDNRGEANRGVAASWNLGVDLLAETGADWLVILSAALRFGDPGGLDFLDELDKSTPYVERDVHPYGIEAAHGIGWHLIAWHRKAFDRAGLFDENYWPAYMEDVDWSRRLGLALGWDAPLTRKVSVDVAIAGFAHGVDLGGAPADPEPCLAYYRHKWGGDKGHETFDRPFGHQPLTYWPRPKRMASWG